MKKLVPSTIPQMKSSINDSSDEIHSSLSRDEGSIEIEDEDEDVDDEYYGHLV